MQHAIPAVLMRGGTSKGLFLRSEDLPMDPRERDGLLLRLMGSPDPYHRQMDGLGGAISSSSKVALISPSLRSDCDVCYRFGQVSVDTPLIDFSGNCGNLAAAVGHYAIEEGLVAAQDGVTTVRVWQENLQERILVHVPVQGGNPLVCGDTEVPGLPWKGAAVHVDFLGRAQPAPCLASEWSAEMLQLPDGTKVRVTLVTAGNATVFVRAADLGLTATERPEDFTVATLEFLEQIRCAGSVRMGLASSAGVAHRERPATPKVAIVGPPCAMEDTAGRSHDSDAMDICARIISMGRAHHAFTTTASVALAVAARIPGTIVHELARPDANPLHLGHAAGIMPLEAQVTREDGVWIARRVRITRTARRLMAGTVYAPVRHR